MVPFQDREWRGTVDRDQDYGAILGGLSHLRAQGTEFCDEGISRVMRNAGTHSLHGVQQKERRCTVSEPMVSGKNTYSLHVFGLEVDLPPLGVLRKLTPQAPAAVKQ